MTSNLQSQKQEQSDKKLLDIARIWYEAEQHMRSKVKKAMEAERERK